MTLWHILCHGLVCASSHISATCVHSQGGWCGTRWGVPASHCHPVSQFLAMLSQWCTQMHSLTLQNLKPRQRGKKESKEDYMKSTR